MAQLTYKKLTAEDVPAYLDLLKKMAKFEELEDIFVCTEEGPVPVSEEAAELSKSLARLSRSTKEAKP